MPRLTRAWTHLSRQRGAANKLDRRMVRQRIQRLQADLKLFVSSVRLSVSNVGSVLFQMQPGSAIRMPVSPLF